MKKNDFIVASINNPDFTVADFKDISEMNLDNTLMLSEDEYLKSKFIRENPLFLDSNGNFVKQKFSDFYRLKLKDFSEFSTESSLDNYQYGLFDTFRKAKDSVRPFGVSFERVHNSERRSTGIIGPNRQGERTLSDRELAQREKVFDYKEGKFKDYTPNDLALTKNPFAWIGSLFDDPLVLATYDENGTHYDPILGRNVEHAKGQKKLNANGVPYYETLAGRSPANKDILSFTDNLTIDGSWINQYDFFDSDGLDKSVAGTVMKNLAVIAPAFIPGAGQYYAGALVVRELAKTLPMLYGMAGLFDNNLPESSLVNNIAALGNKFTGNTSDYAKEKMFSFENFGSLVSDVALQWSQLQFIVESLSKLWKANEAAATAAKAKALGEYTKQATNLMTQGERGEIAMSRVAQLTGAKDRAALAELVKGDKWMNSAYGGAALEKYLTPAMKLASKRTRLAQDLSLGYMAIISNGDVYTDALEHGTSKREAAMLALGSTVGMFSVDKYFGLGEIFYDPALRAERALYRNTVLAETKKITDQLKQITPEVTVKAGKEAVIDERKNLGKYFLKGILAGKKAVQDYKGAIKEGTLGFFGKALGEGLEETSEEFVTDMVKQLGEIAGEFGMTDVKDLGAWKNMKDRYLMSFLGGAVGGGIFALKLGGFQQQQATGELLLMLRQGKGLEIRDELTRLHKAGELGSTQLSYKTAQTYDEKNNPQSVFLTADENNQSLNDYVYNLLTLSIEQIESILQKNHLTKSEDELFEQLVLLDENYTALKDYLQDTSYITGYQRRYQQLVKNIVAQELKINGLKLAAGDGKTTTEIQNAEKDLNNMLLERDKFFNGDYSLEYLQKMLFAINPQLVGAFMPMTKKQYTRSMLGVDYDLLDGGFKTSIDKAYEQYVKDPSKLEEDLDKAFDKFKELQPLMEAILSKHTGGSTQWENIRKTLNEEGILKDEDMYTVDSMLPGEDEESESYVNRTTPKEGESEVDFSKRLRDRAITVAELNARQKIQKLQRVLDEAKTFDYDPATGMSKPATFIDPSTRRYLMAYLGETQNQIKNRLIARIVGTSINKELLNNAENYDELVNKVRESLEVKYGKQIEQLFEDYLGSTDITGLTKFYAKLSSKPKFTLKEALENLDRTGYEDYSLTEQLGFMFEDFTGMEGDFDLLQDIARYEELQAAYMAEADPDKKAELKDELDGLEAKTYDAWNQDYFDSLVKSQVESDLKALEPKLIKLNLEFNSDSDLQAARDLEERLSTEENPAIDLVKELAPKIGSSAVEVEKALESIHQQFMDKEKSTDFILSGDQIKYLEDAKKLINIVTAMVAASSRESNLQDGMTYNKAVNKFYNDHIGRQGGSEFFKNFQPLFEMDEKIGGQLIMALNGYAQEIDEWITLSRANQANSTASLRRASEALSTARLGFMSASMTEHELLKDSVIDPNQENALFHFERQFHENVKKAVAEGKDLKTIIKDLVAHINLDDALLSGITSNIDEDLKDLTAYDKFNYLISLIALDPTELLRKELDFIKNNPNIAPLATQLPGMQLGWALQANPQVVNTALEVLLELAATKGYDVPVLWNTEIVTGLGGGGKTSVEAKSLVNDDEDTWIVGPTSTLIDGLKEIAPKAKAFSVEELIKSIYKGEKKFTTGKGLDGWKPKILTKKDEDFITKDAPKHLVLDETTHVDLLDLQVIAEWAKRAGVRITLLGDENQRGKEYNINREAVLAFRTPRLNFSLRNESIWKVQNLNQLVSMMDRIRNSSDATKDATFDLIKQILKDKLPLSYFENETSLEGDKVVSTLSAEDLSKLTGSVAYIGTNKDRINFIQSNLNPGAVFTALDKDAVQGREFDYVIVDSDWGGALAKGTDGKMKFESGMEATLNMLRDLYTMISRSRRGSIVLDNQLTNIVNPIKEDYTTKYERLSPEVVQDFIDGRTSYIEGLLESIKPTEEPKKEEEKTEEEEEEEEEKELEDPGEENNTEEEKKEAEAVPLIEGEKLNPVGYRAYGNVAFIGNVTKDGKTYKVNTRGPVRDLGIFGMLNPDKPIAVGTDEIRQRVRELNYIKSLYLYDHDIDVYDIPATLRRQLPKDALKKAEFWLVAEDRSDVHNLTGLTTLKLDKLDFIPGKVISIQARINTPSGPVIITLGAVANPDTWIDGINSNPELTPEEKRELIAQAEHYRIQLNNLVNGSVTERRINKPKFNGRTELVLLREGDFDYEGDEENRPDPKLKRSVRLEDLYDDTSEFDARTGNSVVSPIHIITKSIPGISEKVVGHAVLFVSNDNTLSPDQLGKLFIQQQEERAAGRDSKAAVRMLVLDNEGVSFHSLYRGGFKDIYSRSYKDVDVAFPLNLQAMSIRMLASLWNYRADLNTFLNALKTHEDSLGITRELTIEYAKLDTQLYKELQAERKGSDDTKDPVISNTEYRRWLESYPDLDKAKKVIALMDFNEGLDIPRFRVGWSDRTGAYIRRIYGLKEGNRYYKGVKNWDPQNTNGIFINPDLAEQYAQMLDYLFTNVVDKIYDTTSLDKNERINYKETEKWLSESKGKTLTISDDGKVIPIPNLERVKAFPLILCRIASYMHKKMLKGKDAFESERAKKDTEGRGKYHIYLNYEKAEGDIDYAELDSFLTANIGGKEVKGLIQESVTQTDIIGLNPFTYRTGNREGETYYHDCRLDNFFNLIFHGVAFEANYNDFDYNQLKDTLALFKYGFFIDPVLIKNGGTASDMIAPCATNRKLFKIDKIPGNPILEFSFDEYSEAEGEAEVHTETIPLIEAAKSLGLDTSRWHLDGLSEDEIVTFVDRKLDKEINKKIFSKGEGDLTKLIVGVDINGILTLKDKYPDIGNIVSLEASGDGTSFTITNDKGIKYEIRYDDGDIIVNEKTAPGVRKSDDKKEIKTNYTGEEVNKAIQDFVSSHDVYEDSDELKAWMSGNEGIVYSADNLKSIKRDLRNKLDEEGILDNSDIVLLENIIDELINQLNTSDCVK